MMYQIEGAAKERNELLRSAYMVKMGSQYSAEQLIFIDESAKDERTLSCMYGYSLMNTRVVKKNVFVRGKRYTILPALSTDGFIAVEIREGSYDKKSFENFIISQVVCLLMYNEFMSLSVSFGILFSFLY